MDSMTQRTFLERSIIFLFALNVFITKRSLISLRFSSFSRVCCLLFLGWFVSASRWRDTGSSSLFGKAQDRKMNLRFLLRHSEKTCKVQESDQSQYHPRLLPFLKASSLTPLTIESSLDTIEPGVSLIRMLKKLCSRLRFQ